MPHDRFEVCNPNLLHLSFENSALQLVLSFQFDEGAVALSLGLFQLLHLY